MRDILFIFLVGVAILLMAMLACHISRCYDLGKNWFTTPLFGDLRIMQVMSAGHRVTCHGMS